MQADCKESQKCREMTTKQDKREPAENEDERQLNKMRMQRQQNKDSGKGDDGKKKEREEWIQKEDERGSLSAEEH